GEAPVALAIALKTRTLLHRDGFRVAMTRTGPMTTLGNIARTRFCNTRLAALMIRIHADGSPDPSTHGVRTLYPALHRGWTDDIYRGSLRAAGAVQRAVVASTGATDLGLMRRSDLTGFNWANVPVVLVETGFMSNPRESRLLRSNGDPLEVARGLGARHDTLLRATDTVDASAGHHHLVPTDRASRAALAKAGLVERVERVRCPGHLPEYSPQSDSENRSHSRLEPRGVTWIAIPFAGVTVLSTFAGGLLALRLRRELATLIAL